MTDPLAASAPKCGQRSFRVPRSTYRLQFTPEFTFENAIGITDYLNELGITDCYASPVFTAKPGSSHGYDVCNYAELNPCLGGLARFDQWALRLRALNMGLLLDIVPNHMAADPLNSWWLDVLQHGRSSQFAQWFDIDWERLEPGLRDKVLLPILEDRYWTVLESGKLQLLIEAGHLVLGYHHHRLPLSQESLELLKNELTILFREEPSSLKSPCKLAAFEKFVTSLVSNRCQPFGHDPDDTSRGAPLESVVARLISRCTGQVGQPASFNFLHSLLERQHYRLAYWRAGNEALNYRRFFDISELVAVRMELPEVFDAAHKLVFRLIREGKVTGLRVDHPDGLWNPQQYFARLQNAMAMHQASPSIDSETRNTGRPISNHFYVIAEKILMEDEHLPGDWQVAGTTGYDALNLLNGLFLNKSNREAFDQIYRDFVAPRYDFETEVHQSKLKVLRGGLRTDLRVLVRALASIAARTRYGIDFSTRELEEALTSIIARFPVYRTYVTEERPAPNRQELAQIDTAVKLALRDGPDTDPGALRFIQNLLSFNLPPDLDAEGCQDCLQFVMRFQQITGPAMAKGLEDTTFYHFNRFISLNEVGGAPDQFGTDLEKFHRFNARRAQHWPRTLLASATHDTKRGEDLRARLNVLSELPEEWRVAVLKWRDLNRDRKSMVEGREAPDANDEYFLYQVLIGAWVSAAESEPESSAFCRRIIDYMLKAMREAKANTSWIQPNRAYEEATQRFIESILSQEYSNMFLNEFMLFQRTVAFFGLFNSLAQLVLKMTIPGIPDFYQGTELWDYNLVDPDNRRPVDYNLRKGLLEDLRQKLSDPAADMPQIIKGLFKNYQTGQIKQYIIWRILRFRQRHSELFDEGQYQPLETDGDKRDHVCAFVRAFKDQSVVVIATRLVLGLTQGAQRGALESDVWQNTSLIVPGAQSDAHYRNVLTQQIVTVPSGAESIPVSDLLGLLPAAVLERVA